MGRCPTHTVAPASLTLSGLQSSFALVDLPKVTTTQKYRKPISRAYFESPWFGQNKILPRGEVEPKITSCCSLSPRGQTAVDPSILTA